MAGYYGFNANTSFTFQVVKNPSAHPRYLRFGLFCKSLGDFRVYLRNAPRAGSEEGRLFSQAKISASLLHFFINIKMFQLIECYRLIEKMGNGSKCNVMLIALIEF